MLMWIVTIASLFGNFLNSIRIKECFLIWIGCNIYFMAVDISGGVYSRAVLDGVQIGFSVFGYIVWKRKNGKRA